MNEFLPVAARRWVLGLGFLCVAAAAQAQAFPDRPIRMVIGLAPGGAVELTARRFQMGLSNELGVPVVLDYKPGANGVIAHTYVARSKPDGYTIIFNSGSFTQGHAFSKASYDPIKDFSPVTLVSSTPLTVVVKNDSEFRTFDDLVKYGRANPGKVTYGTAGVGNITHLAGELLSKASDVPMLHVPYQGSGPSLNALLAGQVSFSVASVTSIMPMVRGGRLRALTTMGPDRAPLLPDVPSTRELGLPSVVASSWVGVLAPAGTPPAVVQRLVSASEKVLREGELRDTLLNDGSVPLGSGPQAYGKFIREELVRWNTIIEQSKITVE